MAWGWRGRGWVGLWPGRGPFSYLPPWQRPGWILWCGWRWWRYPSPYVYPPVSYSLKDEIAALEDYKKYLEDEKASIEQEIKDVEARIKELKSMLERGVG